MEVGEQGGDVRVSGDIEYQTSHGVLDQLKGSDDRCREASQPRVTVVQAGQDHCFNTELSSVDNEEWTDSPDVVQKEPACPGHRPDVLGEGQPFVRHHSEFPNCSLAHNN